MGSVGKSRNIQQILTDVLEESRGLLYENTSMALDLMAENLYNNYGLNATFKGRSIYIDDKRVASVEMSKEAPQAVGIYKYKLLD